MFESVRPNPGPDGLTRAARIFYVLTVFGFITYGLTIARALMGSYVSPLRWAQTPVTTLLAFITARGIEAQRPWAKWLGYVQGFLALFNFPIGTAIGIAVIIYINRASKAGLFTPSPASTPPVPAGASNPVSATASSHHS